MPAAGPGRAPAPAHAAQGQSVDEQSRRVACAFSEKAVMLRKATTMGGAATYREIAQASTPEAAKILECQVDFSDQVWARVECSVAFQVVAQKCMKSPELKELLL